MNSLSRLTERTRHAHNSVNCVFKIYSINKSRTLIICCNYGKQDIYWIGFVSDFGLYRRQTSQEGTIKVLRLVGPKPSRTRTSLFFFFVRVISYHFSGHLVRSFIMGSIHKCYSCMCQNLLFKSAIIQENDF